MYTYPTSWFETGKVPAAPKLCVVSCDALDGGVLGVGVMPHAVRVTYSRPYRMVVELLRARGFTQVHFP